MTTDWDAVRVFGVASPTGDSTVRPSAYAIIANEEGRIAVVHTPLGLYLPGGGIEIAETPEVAIVREAREECGLAVRAGQWRRRAVEHMYSAAEHTPFEKRSTFCDAVIVSVTGDAIELDHVLHWMSTIDAAASLTPPSHRWAVDEWARDTTNADVRTA